MTAPKQEKWIYQNRNKLNVRFTAAIGAVFDFYTGNVKRSHPLFQNLAWSGCPDSCASRCGCGAELCVDPLFLLRVIAERLGRAK